MSTTPCGQWRQHSLTTMTLAVAPRQARSMPCTAQERLTGLQLPEPRKTARRRAVGARPSRGVRNELGECDPRTSRNRFRGSMHHFQSRTCSQSFSWKSRTVGAKRRGSERSELEGEVAGGHRHPEPSPDFPEQSPRIYLEQFPEPDLRSELILEVANGRTLETR